MTKGISFYFNKAASTYEFASELQKKVAQDLSSMIKHGHYPQVLEIGSGRGLLSRSLIKRITFDKYFHIDISFELLRRLRGVFDKKHFLINARAEKIPFKKEIFDLMVSSSTLHWLENQKISIPSLFESLKEGGSFYFSIFTSGTLKELKEISSISGFGSYYPLEEVSFYIKLFEKSSVKFQYEIKNYVKYYNEPRDLLLSLKLTGTNYTLNKKFSGKRSFLEFCRLYKERFSNCQGIYATYEVLFIKGQK